MLYQGIVHIQCNYNDLNADNSFTLVDSISSLFPKRGNRTTKRNENTGTTALELSVEQTTGGFKALVRLVNF